MARGGGFWLADMDRITPRHVVVAVRRIRFQFGSSCMQLSLPGQVLRDQEFLQRRQPVLVVSVIEVAVAVMLGMIDLAAQGLDPFRSGKVLALV